MGLFCHILIGSPSSGKSTLAEALVQRDPNYRIVSTDDIRAQLFGDATVQGNWSKIEAEVYRQIDEHLHAGYSVIYDATNAKRPRRMKLLRHLNQYATVEWLGWHLKTPLKTCLSWNRQRERKVPDGVIKGMYTSLKQFPPITAEGFATVYTVNPVAKTPLVDQVYRKISHFSRSLINRQNRTQKVRRHEYSQLLDFERLMYLIRILLNYPGVGNLHNSDPETVSKVLGKKQTFERDVDEIAAFIAKIADPIYADPSAIAQDLKWLETNGLIGKANINSDLKLNIRDEPDLVTHSYSDIEPFQRLIQTIRLIIQEPFIWQQELGTLNSLVERMKTEELVDYECRDSLRKDIEKILKPYGILPNFPMKRGYFAGTAILSQPDLVKVFRLLESQAQSLDDPVAFQVYQTFQQRMETAKLAQSKHYPVRAIHNRNIVNLERLPESSLARKTKVLEDAIEQGKLIELGRIPGVGRHRNEQSDELFLVYPLQIVFHNIGWYLGFEYYQGKYKGLLQFERLDRLFFGKAQTKTRSRNAQLRSLNQLITLYQCSGGIFLGHDSQMQRQYLNPKSSEHQKAEVTIEIWFNDQMFAFVSEGTQRFPVNQMKMSQPFNRELMRENRSLFSLRKTSHDQFPHRFRVRLPQWSLEDIDLHRWILGFGGQAKVVNPEHLRQVIQKKGRAIMEVMDDD